MLGVLWTPTSSSAGQTLAGPLGRPTDGTSSSFGVIVVHIYKIYRPHAVSFPGDNRGAASMTRAVRLRVYVCTDIFYIMFSHYLVCFIAGL